jgi:hypothetical protein
MTGSLEQKFRFHNFNQWCARVAVERARAGAMKRLRFYDFLNWMETMSWGVLGAQLGYFAPDAPAQLHALYGLEFQTAYQDFDELYGLQTRVHVTYDARIYRRRRMRPAAETAHLVPRFQAALGLQTEILRGEFSPLLRAISFAPEIAWSRLLVPPPRPDAIAAALGGETSVTDTERIYAEFFGVLDHMAAFQHLFASDDSVAQLFKSSHERNLERSIGIILRWRLDFHKPIVENRFKELIERASLFITTEFTAAGVTELGCVSEFKDRAHELMADWKQRSEDLNSDVISWLGPMMGPVPGAAQVKPEYS